MKTNTLLNQVPKQKIEFESSIDDQDSNDFENSSRLRDNDEFIQMYGSFEFPDPEKIYPETI
jgi:hypothetical protein